MGGMEHCDHKQARGDLIKNHGLLLRVNAVAIVN